MKFYQYRTSDWFNKKEVEINSLEDLLSISEAEGQIIIYKEMYGDYCDTWMLEIYDDYRE